MQNSSPAARLYDGSGRSASQKSNDNFLKFAHLRRVLRHGKRASAVEAMSARLPEIMLMMLT